MPPTVTPKEAPREAGPLHRGPQVQRRRDECGQGNGHVGLREAMRGDPSADGFEAYAHASSNGAHAVSEGYYERTTPSLRVVRIPEGTSVNEEILVAMIRGFEISETVKNGEALSSGGRVDAFKGNNIPIDPRVMALFIDIASGRRGGMELREAVRGDPSADGFEAYAHASSNGAHAVSDGYYERTTPSLRVVRIPEGTSVNEEILVAMIRGFEISETVKNGKALSGDGRVDAFKGGNIPIDPIVMALFIDIASGRRG